MIFTHRFAVIFQPTIVSAHSRSKRCFWDFVMGLCVKVLSFRLSDFYPHKMWCEKHFLLLSLLFSFMFIRYPIYSLSMEYETPHFICIFTNFFILFHPFSHSFFSSLSCFCMEGFHIFQNNGKEVIYRTYWFTSSFHHTPN